jgi:hypothetical protein
MQNIHRPLHTYEPLSAGYFDKGYGPNGKVNVLFFAACPAISIFKRCDIATIAAV